MGGEAAKKRRVVRRFGLRGLTLGPEALEETLAFLSHFPEDDAVLHEALDLLIDQIAAAATTTATGILDGHSVRRVASLLIDADAAPSDSKPAAPRLRIIDAFNVPKFRYDSVNNLFYQHTGSLPVHGDAGSKAALYRDRFQLLHQRISRDEHFSRPVFDDDGRDAAASEITPIQSLIGRRGRRWIMGVISQLEDGRFFLEDLTAAVPIDLANAKITSGFFVENTVIVAEGEMLLNGTFQVSTCGFPPLEDRETSLSSTMGLDFFGEGVISKEETLMLSTLEEKAVNDMFVILSEVWLDNSEILEKLAMVLDGYNNVDVVPSLFVLMGNFSSHPCNLSFNSYSSLRSCFTKLGEIINTCDRLKEQSKFLFIPGPTDAGPSTVLPRCALPKFLTEELQKLVPNAVFSSNPCRVKYYNQEIVFFRQDLLFRMRRSSLIPPSADETSDPFEHLVATITHQSHLCPLPLTVQPIIWNYDHCLWLYPTPHTIVLGDRSEQKAFKYTGTTCFNPGSFSDDYTFVAYRPCSQEVELSAL